MTSGTGGLINRQAGSGKPAAPQKDNGVPALSVRNRGKRFGTRVVFQDVPFEIAQGEVLDPSPAVSEEARLPTPGRTSAVLRVLPGDVVVMPGKGLQFPRHLPFDRWVGVGRRLSAVHTSSAWYLGDWIVYGEMAYHGRYRDAIEQTSLDYQTLRNYAWVVRRFSLSRRRDSLSFGHHAEVAALPEAEQDYWLRKAEESGWPVKRLRCEVRASLSERSAGDGTSRAGGCPGTSAQRPVAGLQLQLQLTPEQMHACQVAASKVGLPMQAWAIRTLDQAARQE